MAEKEPIIVVKKITIEAAGAHGGSWKVAFADFMTAMMAFFLVMWLLSQSDEVKKNVADYFSTPSVIEYNFANYGVELTLEKLFLDLVNEPLEFFQQFMQPADYTPNPMAMGSKKIVLHHLADKLGDSAANVEVTETEIRFEIPADMLFVPGTAKPSPKFIEVMKNVSGITAGLEESNVYVDSEVFKQATSNNATKANNVAERRLDLVTKKLEASLEHPTVDIYGKTVVENFIPTKKKRKPIGSIKFQVKHKENLLKDRKARKFDEVFSKKDQSMNVYDGFVNQLSERNE